MAVVNLQYLIDIQEGLGFAEQLVFSNTGQSLSDIQRAVLQKSWQGQRKTYDQIAQELGYSASYIKQTVAPKLWKLFSEALGEKVSKTNFRSVLERRQVNQESSHTQELIGVLKQGLEPYEKGKLQSTAKQQISNVSFPNHPQSQILNPQSQQLELPEGRVPLASRFYVERVPYEFRCYEEIVKPGAFIHIKAPRQMGKTSLMVRILAHAETQGYQTVRLNLQRVDVEILTNLDKFLRWLAYNVTRKLNLKPMLDDYWHKELGSKVSCTTYFQDYLLEQIDSPIVLALDEVNEIFEYPKIAQDFLPLLRSWYEEAKDSKIWQKLRLVLVNSTEVYLPLTIHQSPFTVGLPIQLSSFSWEQVQDLAQRHELDLSIGDLAQLMWLVAGHPYLLRLALYYLARQDLTPEELVQRATSDKGIYSEHLQRQWWTLQQHPDLAVAFETVLRAKVPVALEQVQAFKLYSMGLVNWSDNQVMVSCNLYQRYFSNRFHSHSATGWE
ncbi:MAG: hypothetical protein F6K56_02455 [Moorea sp. SIO3G5]|nr:hypothetical protein [Moorena sp. SIO3G5]